MREGREDSAAISETYLLGTALDNEHERSDDEQSVVKDGGGRARCCRRCALGLLIRGPTTSASAVGLLRSLTTDLESGLSTLQVVEK